MLIGIGVVLGLGLALAMGGSWAGLAQTRWRLAPLCFAGFVMQIVLFSSLAALLGPYLVHGPALHIVSVALVLISLGANVRIPGVAAIALGTALNLAVIAANDGQMPRAEAPGAKPFTNTKSMHEGTRLVVLGDWIAVPALPGNRLFSIGDVLIAGGGALTAFALTRRPDGPRGVRLAPAAWPAQRV